MIAARYERSSPVVRRAARGLNDGYLRANRVAEGIGSYEAVLRLMLGTRFDPGLDAAGCAVGLGTRGSGGVNDALSSESRSVGDTGEETRPGSKVFRSAHPGLSRWTQTSCHLPPPALMAPVRLFFRQHLTKPLEDVTKTGRKYACRAAGRALHQAYTFLGEPIHPTIAMARTLNSQTKQRPEDSAKAAGLRYTTDGRPGIRRLRRGSAFRYIGSHGRSDSQPGYARPHPRRS